MLIYMRRISKWIQICLPSYQSVQYYFPIMADKIKLFLTAQKYFEMMGIYSSQLNRTFVLNAKILLFFVSMIRFLIDQMLFLKFKANTIIEYGVAVYGLITQCTIIVVLLIVLLKVANIFELIEYAEEFIETSK